MLKAHKFCILPSQEQAHTMSKFFGATRFAFNWGLDKKIKLYTTDKSRVSCFELINELTQLKKQTEYEWLKDTHSQVLQMCLRNLDNSFSRFFSKSIKSGFPRFKSRKHPKQSFQYPQGVKIDLEAGSIYLPKIGMLPCIFHRKLEGSIKTCTVSRNASGRYFVSILVENDRVIPPKVKLSDTTKVVGIDVGIKQFATVSDGTVIANPKYLKNKLVRLAVKQRQLARKAKGSNLRLKARTNLAKVHETVANQRNDFLHKITHKLISENQAVVCEDLYIKGMVRNHKLAQAISDVSWSKFFDYLSYKSEWYGKHFIQIGRFDASSQICSVCGNQNSQVKDLSVRSWKCPKCHTTHDRDINASTNIKNFGLIQLGFKELEPSINKSSLSGVGCHEL